MKVFLRKDIEKVGIAGELIKVNDGYARNFLFPRGLAIEITKENESYFQGKVKKVEHRKEVVATKTSMLAERIRAMNITLKRKMHDDGKLYGSVGASEIVEELAKDGISIAKNQVLFTKSIKSKGTFEVTIKLTSSLKPKIKITILPE